MMKDIMNTYKFVLHILNLDIEFLYWLNYILSYLEQSVTIASKIHFARIFKFL